MPPIDEMMITEPPPRETMCGIARLASHRLLLMFDAMILSNCSSEIPASGPKYGFTAALQTRMSMPPYCLTVPAISASTSCLREMLHGMTVASPPLPLMPAATASQASALRLDTTTLAPRAAQCSAIERPMPRLEPVMIATLLSRLNGEAMAYSLVLWSMMH